MKLAQEAVVVGLACVLLGSAIGAAIGPVLAGPPGDWNRHHVMEASLFATGVLAHMIFEATGANRWYCKNGSACLPRSVPAVEFVPKGR